MYDERAVALRDIDGDGGRADRPLFAQFCASEPEHFAAAVRAVGARVDAVDLNLGCPQEIARKGNYGAFLMDDLARVERIVRAGAAAAAEVGCRVTAKIRVFADAGRTVEYARMLEAAGCRAIAVHGRLRAQRQHQGRVRLDVIRAVVEAVGVPVIANGGCTTRDEGEAILAATGAAAVMVANGLLANPALAAGKRPDPFRDAWAYLQHAEQRGVPTVRFIRDHLVALFGGARGERWFPDLYSLVARNKRVTTVKQFQETIVVLARRWGRTDVWACGSLLSVREIIDLGCGEGPESEGEELAEGLTLFDGP